MSLFLRTTAGRAGDDSRSAGVEDRKEPSMQLGGADRRDAAPGVARCGMAYTRRSASRQASQAATAATSIQAARTRNTCNVGTS